MPGVGLPSPPLGQGEATTGLSKLPFLTRFEAVARCAALSVAEAVADPAEVTIPDIEAAIAKVMKTILRTLSFIYIPFPGRVRLYAL